ncbi:hypothetical protein C2G38_2047769 [Gigaspora rosea]|uniref:Uncharacterized protein n=1 Tax=Gigaspora rosea TaxID=44941 RepID=A0A397U819_9GLOM|nr:hypothetical protein C2G38_2047769 [Gigaspora rosea]
MEETLSEHPKVRKIIDAKTVICICGKQIRLDRNYDPDLLDVMLKNAINKPIPEEKNQKYTPMVLYKNSPFYQYCKNANIMELLGYFNDPEDCTPKFWNQLSKMGRSGAFKDNQIFSGLCEIFVEMTNRINERKGLQNIRYPEQFSNFLTILATSSPQTYAIF